MVRMAIIRAQVTLTKRSNIPTDVVVNTWHFNTSGAIIPSDHANIASKLTAFYQAINTKLSPSLNINGMAHTIKQYLVTPGGPGGPDDVFGSPLDITNFTLSDPGASGFPAEVAVALSMKASTFNVSEEVGATRPAARRRGRIFLGPMATSSSTPSATTLELRVENATQLLIRDQAVLMHTALGALSPAIKPSVYSVADGLARAVVQYSVDNAFDTIRSRGPEKTLREIGVVL